MQMKPRTWLFIFFGVIILFFVAPFLISFVWLTNFFENKSYDSIVKTQANRNAIYGTAFNQNTFSYKLKLVNEIKPSVVALGSSRVLQFREEAFKASFANAGNAMNHLSEGILFFRQMIKTHKPEFVILGLDFWWFNHNFSQPDYFPYHSNDGLQMTKKKILLPYLYLIQGRIPLQMFYRFWDSKPYRNIYTNYDNLGFFAARDSTGFRKDGSYFYSNTIFGIQKSDDRSFADTISRIHDGNRRFQHGKQISRERIELADDLINEILSNGIKLIIIVPPVANQISAAMNSDDYLYLNEFISYVLSVDAPVFNYHDLSVLTEDDCECIDGFHGGDVIYKRILLDIYNSMSVPEFNAILNIEDIRSDIQQFSGKVLTVNAGDNYLLSEIDFLELDCDK